MSRETQTLLFVVPTNRIPSPMSWAPSIGLGHLLVRAQSSTAAVLKAVEASSAHVAVERCLAALAADLDAVADVCDLIALDEAATTADGPVDAVVADDVPGWMEEAHDMFFHIRRAPRGRCQWLQDRARLFGAVCRQVAQGMFDRDTVDSIVRFIASELGTRPFTAEPPFSGSGASLHIAGPLPTGQPDMENHGPLDVWRRGHHFLATACVAARAGLQDVAHAISERDADAARASLMTSTQAVQAVTASYALAGDVSAATYNDVIRPMMCPPHTAIEMNGSLNVEYRDYHRAWATVSADLRKHRDRFGDGQWGGELIPLVEALFLSVVIEAHAHVTAAWRLVRGSTALHQDSTATENGVMVLLSHVARRRLDYREFIGA